jgi:APA family basic amino acid/polyamine antiporter
MLGAGVFAAIGPAAAAAGAGMVIGLGCAAIVAACNASSSARLAARYPASGGTYVYGRERLGHVWGFLAGWGFVVGKTASCAAMAMTFGAYAFPGMARPFAVLAVVGLTAVNLAGVQKTARLTAVIVACVVAALAVVAVAGSTSELSAPLGSFGTSGVHGILQSAGLLFFAFAGYARIATLGEEVRDPATTIPRAIAIALSIALVIYTVVTLIALWSVGPHALATSPAPLETVVRSGTLDWAVPVVRIGAAVASLGVLISLLAGVSRTTFAMASAGDLPRRLSAVQPTTKVPHVAEVAIAAIVIVVVSVADVRGAIGFSSFAVLCYYGVANASAWTLSSRRRWMRGIPALGLVGCATLALSLPFASVASGLGVVALGWVVWLVRRRRAVPAR